MVTRLFFFYLVVWFVEFCEILFLFRAKQSQLQLCIAICCASSSERYTISTSRYTTGANTSNSNTSNVCTTTATQQQVLNITVNRQPVDAAQQQLLMQMGVTAGDYWYDHTSGGFGRMGGPCRGAIRANLALPGPMPADASNGNARLFEWSRIAHDGLLDDIDDDRRSMFAGSLVVQLARHARYGRQPDSDRLTLARLHATSTSGTT